MIKKITDTATIEVWVNEKSPTKERYLLKKTWSDEANHAVVITIHPGSCDPFISDLTTLFIEKHIRLLGYSGFYAINLFSTVNGAVKKISEENEQVIETILKDKSIQKVIFACGSVIETNKLAHKECYKIYDQCSEKLKKRTSMLSVNGKQAHPLNVYCRNNWQLSTMEKYI